MTTPLSTPQFAFATASVRGQQLFGLSLRTSQMSCLILLVHHICTFYSLSVVSRWLIFIISTPYFKTLHAMDDKSTNETVDWQPYTILSARLINHEDKKGHIFYYFQVATADNNIFEGRYQCYDFCTQLPYCTPLCRNLVNSNMNHNTPESETVAHFIANNKMISDNNFVKCNLNGSKNSRYT